MFQHCENTPLCPKTFAIGNKKKHFYALVFNLQSQ